MAAAVEAAATGKAFDVVLMDMQMPVTRRATEPRLQAPPGMGYGGFRSASAHGPRAMTEDRERCEAAGCDDYLTKPVNRERLLEIVAKFSEAGRAPNTILVSTLKDDERT